MTAGYSAKPLAAKLGITPAARVLLTGVPGDFRPTDALPGVTLARRGAGPFDVVLLFCPRSSVLTRRFATLVPVLATNGALWVCWPKRASGVSTDLSENDVRAHGLHVGLVDVKIAAVDQTWSGLKFVRRLAER